MTFHSFQLSFFIILVQLEGGHFQEQTQEYARWKELRDRLAADLRLSVSTMYILSMAIGVIQQLCGPNFTQF